MTSFFINDNVDWINSITLYRSHLPKSSHYLENQLPAGLFFHRVIFLDNSHTYIWSLCLKTIFKRKKLALLSNSFFRKIQFSQRNMMQFWDIIIQWEVHLSPKLFLWGKIKKNTFYFNQSLQILAKQ